MAQYVLRAYFIETEIITLKDMTAFTVLTVVTISASSKIIQYSTLVVWRSQKFAKNFVTNAFTNFF